MPNVHRPLIMELMLWLMTRSLVGLLRSSGDFEARLSDDATEEEIFGFDSLMLQRFDVGIQG